MQRSLFLKLLCYHSCSRIWLRTRFDEFGFLIYILDPFLKELLEIATSCQQEAICASIFARVEDFGAFFRFSTDFFTYARFARVLYFI